MSSYLSVLTAFALLSVCTFSAHASPTANPACSTDQVFFETDDGIVGIDVEIADDPQERAQGLMNRTELAAKQGMLFVYETPQQVAFWMKNTLIPLDMVFMDATGTIRHIHENAVPHDETPIPGAAQGDAEPERLMILEISGGDAARLGIATGQAMAFPGLDQNIAAAPCDKPFPAPVP